MRGKCSNSLKLCKLQTAADEGPDYHTGTPLVEQNPSLCILLPVHSLWQQGSRVNLQCQPRCWQRTLLVHSEMRSGLAMGKALVTAICVCSTDLRMAHGCLTSPVAGQADRGKQLMDLSPGVPSDQSLCLLLAGKLAAEWA